ncbi:MAG: leucyl aminopeptidase [Dehalococcoidia bacterium]|nr:leucyl aminopeptidase [Dehalococcoidia bacterium]
MKIESLVGDVTGWTADAVVVNLFEGVKLPGGATGAVDAALGGVISQLIADGEIKGMLGEVTIIHTLGKLPSPRVAVAGLGKAADFDLDRVRRVSADVGRALKRIGVKRAATIVHGAGIGGLEAAAATQALVEGAILGQYSFRRHLSNPEQSGLEELTVVERDADKLSAIELGISTGRIMADAANFARDLINEPSNFMTPTDLAAKAQEVAQDFGLTCEIFDRDELERLGMGGVLGVSCGSAQPPKLIVLRYMGTVTDRPAVGLVGKGVCFDSGGISIKPEQGMSNMRNDMAGGATVIATLRALAALKSPLSATAIVPAVENMPSGCALKPGDVIRFMNGKTAEIHSTDAEGRLILADGLAYAVRQGLSPIVDIATLTGGIVTALGNSITGIFSKHQDLADKISRAGTQAGEKMWQLPLYEEYNEAIKGDYADLKNSGGRAANSITAALFLSNFVEDVPWLHMDIAGTVRTDKDKGYLVKFATGVAVRTLTNFVLALAKE